MKKVVYRASSSTQRRPMAGPKPKPGVVSHLNKVLLPLFLVVGFFCIFGLSWVQKNFTGVTPDMMILQLRMPLKGTGSGYFLSFFLRVLLPSIALTAVIILIKNAIQKKNRERDTEKPESTVAQVVMLLAAVAFFAGAGWRGLTALEVPQYLANRSSSSDFIENNYVDPTAELLSFPGQKRNLVYIFIESMESTFYTKAQGGQLDQETIPELYQLAQNSVSFSDKELAGGAIPLPGMGITSAGMVSQSSGLPLLVATGWKGEEATEVFIPNATVLGDVLADAGYAQYLMVGSDAEFGARDKYYKAHGNATILDLYTARESGVIDKTYDNGFWGMEDKYLFEYAKQELPGIAAGGQPFSFTLLTVDSHFPDGFDCSLCENQFKDQYANVLACTSRQVAEFVEWLKQQDFYQNTTIVISGDHLSMDENYFTKNQLDMMNRRVYNAIINPAGLVPVQTQNRMFSSVDMFPTTLAAMGVTIEGDRLGLGTNLFSDKPTLPELYGYDLLHQELSKTSDFYNNTFYGSAG